MYATLREFRPLVECFTANHLGDINARGSNHEGETAFIPLLASRCKYSHIAQELIYQ